MLCFSARARELHHAALHSNRWTTPRSCCTPRYARVETIGFDYGQCHAVEPRCRSEVIPHLISGYPHWAAKLGADMVIKLDVIREVSESALTRDAEIAMGASGLPMTFVPGRNLRDLRYKSGTGTH